MSGVKRDIEQYVLYRQGKNTGHIYEKGIQHEEKLVDNVVQTCSMCGRYIIWQQRNSENKVKVTDNWICPMCSLGEK